MSGGLKRVLSSIVIVPTVLAVFVFGNKYIIDAFVSIIAARCIYELFNAFKQKGFHPVEPLGYIAAASICFLHVIPKEYIITLVGAIIITTILVSFMLIITKKTKTDVADVAITFFSVCYIIIFLMFVSIVRNNIENGVWLVWYIFLAAWFTDVFAYVVGRTIGKHYFTEISPKKTIEGCIGGVIGSIIFCLMYTFIINKFFCMNINYITITIISIVLSLIGQLGDFSASTIKRYTGVKDFSNLLPGHGGMIDRCDSVVFIAPFAYILLTVFI